MFSLRVEPISKNNKNSTFSDIWVKILMDIRSEHQRNISFSSSIIQNTLPSCVRNRKQLQTFLETYLIKVTYKGECVYIKLSANGCPKGAACKISYYEGKYAVQHKEPLTD